jgi:hypothetical protein
MGPRREQAENTDNSVREIGYRDINWREVIDTVQLLDLMVIVMRNQP